MAPFALRLRPAAVPGVKPLREQGSFDDLELQEILRKPMTALPLGPEEDFTDDEELLEASQIHASALNPSQNHLVALSHDDDDDDDELGTATTAAAAPLVPLSPEEEHEAMLAKVQKQVAFYYGDRNFPTDKVSRRAPPPLPCWAAVCLSIGCVGAATVPAQAHQGPPGPLGAPHHVEHL